MQVVQAETRRATEGTSEHVRCRFCGHALRYTFVDLGMSPLCQSHIEAVKLNHREPFYPLHVRVCDGCFLVQLEEYVSPADIFSDYAYFSSYSDTWLEHARRYVDTMTERLGLGPESRVVELASNDGYLLQYFVKKGIPVLGVEPAANVAAVAVEKGIPTIVEFFGESVARRLVAEGKAADLVVGNNVLAHVPDLNGFVEGIRVLLKPQGVVTMEFPHLMRLIDENQFDTIYHEHFSYFSYVTVEQVFAAHGLTILDVEELPTHGGSLRIYASHSAGAGSRITARARELKDREVAAGFSRLETYVSFEEQVRRTKWKLLDLLITLKGQGKTIVGYGAPGKGNTLLNYCGIRTDFLEYTVDRSPHKQGKYTPGTHIPIRPVEHVRETKPDYLLILPWNLKEEIMRQMVYIREWGGQFIVPIPDAKVYQ